MDEYISILFEALNTRGQPRFVQLSEAAKSGNISRSDFVVEISKVEFESAKATKDLLVSLNPSSEDRKQSYFYDRFANCPNDYEKFAAYRKGVSPQRDYTGYYKKQYDQLRGALEERKPKVTP